MSNDTQTLLDQAEQIINDKAGMVPLDDFPRGLYRHLLKEKDSITLDITGDALKSFVNTPMGRLWTLMSIKATTSNRDYFLESIKEIRKILTNVKTLSDAAMLTEPQPKPDNSDSTSHDTWLTG